jgi:hypothetical protein
LTLSGPYPSRASSTLSSVARGYFQKVLGYLNRMYRRHTPNGSDQIFLGCIEVRLLEEVSGLILGETISVYTSMEPRVDKIHDVTNVTFLINYVSLSEVAIFMFRQADRK